MANGDIERRPRRRRGANWVWWIVGALVIVLIVWWWVGDWGVNKDNGYALDNTEQVAPAPAATPAPGAATTDIPVNDIVANPGTYRGQSFSGPIEVTGAPTARGFWAQSTTSEPGMTSAPRIFVVVTDQPQGQPLNVTSGARYTLQNAMVRESSAASTVPGEPLDQQTRSIVSSQPVFLTVSAMDIKPANGTQGQTGNQPGAYGGAAQDGVNEPAAVSPGNDQGGM